MYPLLETDDLLLKLLPKLIQLKSLHISNSLLVKKRPNKFHAASLPKILLNSKPNLSLIGVQSMGLV